MWWILFPVFGVVGLVLLLAVIIAAVAGVVVAWPWLLVGLGVWMLLKGNARDRRSRGAVVVDPTHGKRRHGHRAKHTQPIETLCPEPTPIRPRTVAPATAQAPAPPPEPELPIDLQLKVDQISRKAEALLRYADRFPPFSRDLYLVRQTTAEYLPRTVEAFLKLPPEAAERIVTATGRTPHAELKSQLDLLDEKLDEVTEDLQREDVDRLLANRRFLESRFGRAIA